MASMELSTGGLAPETRRRMIVIVGLPGWPICQTRVHAVLRCGPAVYRARPRTKSFRRLTSCAARSTSTVNHRSLAARGCGHHAELCGTPLSRNQERLLGRLPTRSNGRTGALEFSSRSTRPRLTPFRSNIYADPRVVVSQAPPAASRRPARRPTPRCAARV